MIPPVLVAFAVVMGMQSATAQDLGGALDLGQLGATLAVSNAIRNQAGRRHPHAAHRPRSAAAERTPEASAQAKALLRYRPNDVVHRRFMDGYLARIRRGDPATATQLEQAFAAQPLRDVSARWLGRYGLSPNGRGGRDGRIPFHRLADLARR